MDLISWDDFSLKFPIILKHYKDPIGQAMTLLMIGRVEYRSDFESLKTQVPLQNMVESEEDGSESESEIRLIVGKPLRLRSLEDNAE